jgi:hypothetical protein
MIVRRREGGLVMAVGYSGTPLAQKLGVKDAQRTWRYRMPENVAQEISNYGVSPKLLKSPAAGLEMVHVFVTERSDLSRLLHNVRPMLEPAGLIWVSWPKKTAKVATDITEHVVRAEAFPLGLVDIKVCAVDETWSGLKLVIRKTERVKEKM